MSNADDIANKGVQKTTKAVEEPTEKNDQVPDAGDEDIKSTSKEPAEKKKNEDDSDSEEEVAFLDKIRQMNSKSGAKPTWGKVAAIMYSKRDEELAKKFIKNNRILKRQETHPEITEEMLKLVVYVDKRRSSEGSVVASADEPNEQTQAVNKDVGDAPAANNIESKAFEVAAEDKLSSKDKESSRSKRSSHANLKKKIKQNQKAAAAKVTEAQKAVEERADDEIVQINQVSLSPSQKLRVNQSHIAKGPSLNLRNADGLNTEEELSRAAFGAPESLASFDAM